MKRQVSVLRLTWDAFVFIACLSIAYLSISSFHVNAVLNAQEAVGTELGIPVARSIRETSGYLRSEEFETVPVDLEAAVTYWDTEQKLFFVQDGDDAVFVELPSEAYRNFQFKSGTRVRIVGWLKTTEYYLVAENVTVVKYDDPLPPKTIDLGELRKGSSWSRRIQTEGSVTAAVRYRDRNQVIVRAANGKNAICCLPKGGMRMDSIKIGQALQCTGVLDWDIHRSGAPRRALIRVMDWEDVRMVGEASPVAPQDVTPVEDFRELEQFAPGTFVSVQGLVGYVSPGVSFVVENASGSVSIDYVGIEAITQGCNVDVQGVLEQEDGKFRIRLVTLTDSTHVSAPPVARPTSALAVVEANQYNGRVSLKGELISVSSDDEARELLLTDAGINYRAIFTASDRAFAELGLQAGDIVHCNGLIVRTRVSERMRFTLNVDSLQDVVVVQPKGHRDGLRIGARSLFYIALSLCTLACLSAVWLGTLRSQVRQKTEHLQGLTAILNASYESIDEGILVVGRDGQITSANSRFAEITQELASPGMPASDLFDRLAKKIIARDGVRFWPVFDQYGSVPTLSSELALIDDQQQQLQGYMAPIKDPSGTEIGTLITLNDVTQQRDLEAQLVQSQKMEAVGCLAGGVAHDFNNLLAIILYNVDTARLSLADQKEPWGDLQENLKETELAASRATHLVRNLMSFSRISPLELRVVSVNDIINNVSTLIRRSFKSNIKIEETLEPQIWPNRVDQVQIEQVLMNVCLNARDAIGDADGTIQITTQNVHDDGGDKSIRLRVHDTGEGMPSSVLQRMFEPFFTTKQTGEGTGLGMSMSYGIIAQHGGRIECQSSLGVGTIVDIILPRANAEDGAPAPFTVPKMTPSSDQSPNGGACAAKVLVIDDEKGVRTAAAMTMRNFGCTVIDVSNGRDALAMLIEDDFDLVLLDFNMPELSGRDVFMEIKRRAPSLPVAICTGYLADAIDVVGHDGEKPIAFLQKPFRRIDLQELCNDATAQHFCNRSGNGKSPSC